MGLAGPLASRLSAYVLPQSWIQPNLILQHGARRQAVIEQAGSIAFVGFSATFLYANDSAAQVKVGKWQTVQQTVAEVSCAGTNPVCTMLSLGQMHFSFR